LSSVISECLGTPDKPELGDQMVIAAVSKIKKVGGDVSAWIPLVDQELGELHQNELKKTKKGKEPENEGEFVTLSEVLNWDRKSFEDKKSFMDEWIKQELSQWESNTKEVLGSKERERFLRWEPKWEIKEQEEEEFKIHESAESPSLEKQSAEVKVHPKKRPPQVKSPSSLAKKAKLSGSSTIEDATTKIHELSTKVEDLQSEIEANKKKYRKRYRKDCKELNADLEKKYEERVEKLEEKVKKEKKKRKEKEYQLESERCERMKEMQELYMLKGKLEAFEQHSLH